jgi:hypothetical protein
MKTPVLAGWSHMRAGNVRYLVKKMNMDFGKSVLASGDKKTHDINFNGTSAIISKEVLLELACPTTDIALQWMQDANISLDSAFEGCSVVLSNGETYVQTRYGYMKSGVFVTFILNSFNQLITHIDVMYQMGANECEIMSDEYKCVFFGDDSLNKFPIGFDVERYRKLVHDITPIGDWHVHDSWEGVEFCSNHIVKHEGDYGMIPVRFTKHIMNLNVMDPKSIPDALLSYMREYCFDEKKFQYFADMYLNRNYDLSLYVARQACIQARLGDERLRLPNAEDELALF